MPPNPPNPKYQIPIRGCPVCSLNRRGANPVLQPVDAYGLAGSILHRNKHRIARIIPGSPPHSILTSIHRDVYWLQEVCLHRTQVYLEESHYEMLRSLARRRGKSLAAVLRDIIDSYLQAPAPTAATDPFQRVIGIGKGDGSAVAENYEDYLYGEKS
jgi:hypothetical protein